MFSALKTDISARILSTSRHFRATCEEEFSGDLAVSKGMVFVQLYAVWEFAVKGAFRSALNELSAKSVPIKTIRLELLGLVLRPELESVVKAGRKKFWEKSHVLFARTGSPDPAPLIADAFPSDGSQFRLTQIYTIWDLFGVADPVLPDVQLTQLVPEIVDRRNAIAHGRETPEAIGKRYSEGEIKRKIAQTEIMCLHVADTLEMHCSSTSHLTR